LAAAGFQKGDVVLNTFSYHFTPGGFIMDSGAQALGCAVIPAGPGNIEQQFEAIRLFRPSGYCGTPDFLKILLDKAAEASIDVSCITKAKVSGAAFPPSLQAEIKARGVDAYQSYATADLGIIAYETPARQGLVVNEGLIVEIVRPGSDEPAAAGEVGEVVVTRLNEDYPLLRLGTGDLSKVLDGPSSCGRTNMRLAGWMGRADQRAKVKGMFVDPAQVAALAKRHPELGRLRLVVTRANEQDVMTLRAEAASADAALAAKVGETLAGLTKLKGAVELVKPGSLPNDGKVIADERG
jgi:phenylacetate-CoA ligase